MEVPADSCRVSRRSAQQQGLPNIAARHGSFATMSTPALLKVLTHMMDAMTAGSKKRAQNAGRQTSQQIFGMCTNEELQQAAEPVDLICCGVGQDEHGRCFHVAPVLLQLHSAKHNDSTSSVLPNVLSMLNQSECPACQAWFRGIMERLQRHQPPRHGGFIV